MNFTIFSFHSILYIILMLSPLIVLSYGIPYLKETWVKIKTKSLTLDEKIWFLVYIVVTVLSEYCTVTNFYIFAN